jgi:hypothetical protein
MVTEEGTLFQAGVSGSVHEAVAAAAAAAADPAS